MITEYPQLSLVQSYPGVDLLRRAAPRFVDQLEKVQSEGRDFGQKYIAPVALEVDDRVSRDHSYFPWDIVQRAAEYRYLSFILPKIIGGGGHTCLGMAILMEELCAHCAGIGNIIGSTNLGLAPLAVGGYDMRKYYLCLKDTIEGEQKGKPVLWAFALTEPEAGSDIWDADEIKKNESITQARSVPGGYILNGRKIFISNGSVARYISVYAVKDRTDPVHTMLSLVVPGNSTGFTVSRVEIKMGQRACPAAELEFNDVFVPETNRLGQEGTGLVQSESAASASRGPVGAIGVGIARGALQVAWSYAAKKVIDNHRLIDEQWVQIALSDMMSQIHAARQSYFIAALTSDVNNPIMSAAIGGRFNPGTLVDHVVSAVIDNRLVKNIVCQPKVNKTLSGYFMERDSPSNRKSRLLRSALSSAAKIAGSDVAMSVTTRALDITGTDGSRRELGLEKRFRDAKITQIYEGTNQINRLNLFKKISNLVN